MTPNDRRENLRRAARARWARIAPEDRAGELLEARRGFLRRFANEVDPRHELPAEERHRLAVMRRRQYMAELPRRRSPVDC